MESAGKIARPPGAPSASARRVNRADCTIPTESRSARASGLQVNWVREWRNPKHFGGSSAESENLPVYLGNIQLPPNARLRLQVHNDVTLDPLQMVDIAQSPGAGALYQVTLAVSSKNCNFLEAMLRAYINGAKDPLFLSSGTEDYFLGTYYFNRGMYHLPLAGLTHKDAPAAGPCQFSAYRFHDEDPIIFQKGLRLAWRNGEEKDGKAYGSPQQSQMTSYVWLYEW